MDNFLVAGISEMKAISGTEAGCSMEELWSAVQKFTAWLEKTGYRSYDPYDFWGTSYGRFARRLYYKKNPAGVLLTAPFILLEILYPGYRRLFVEKNRYPTADAQLGLAFLNLYESKSEQEGPKSSAAQASQAHDRPAEYWLARAKEIAAGLLKQSVPGYKGNCWGYPFDWQHVNGLMPKGTPHITATPYCYELFTTLYDLTGEGHYFEVAKSIATFVFEDLKDTPTGEDSAASSYTPYDRTKVVNASAYRAFVLMDAAERFQKEDYRTKALKNVRFILQSQNGDGSWLYAIDNPAEAFIDNFHTCFVLKNLYKLNRRLQSSEVRQAVQRGYEWYRKALFDEEENPRSYAIAPRVEIVRLELYNVAEAISLGLMLKDEFPNAAILAGIQTARLIRKYQVPRGHWVTRIYIGGIRHTLPYLRWSQSQLFLALTNFLAAASKQNNPVNECLRVAQ
jgi:hypothetical protein